jgi:serine/threonine protein kinase
MTGPVCAIRGCSPMSDRRFAAGRRTRRSIPRHRVGSATDILALGCVLYEILAGEPPCARGHRHSVTRCGAVLGGGFPQKEARKLWARTAIEERGGLTDYAAGSGRRVRTSLSIHHHPERRFDPPMRQARCSGLPSVDVERGLRDAWARSGQTCLSPWRKAPRRGRLLERGGSAAPDA